MAPRVSPNYQNEIHSAQNTYVESVKQPVREAPEEKQNGHESNRVDGLSKTELRRISALAVLRLKRPPLEKLLEAHGDGRLAGDGATGEYLLT